MNKKALFLYLLFLIPFVGIAQKNKEVPFHYSGTHWERYNGHRMTIVVLDTSVGGTRLIAEQIIKNGTFDVSGVIKYPQNAFFGMYNPHGDYVYKQEFILEPGNLKIDHDSVSGNILVTGGAYNTIFSAIANDPQAAIKIKAFNDYSATLTPEDFKDETIKKKYTDLRNASFGYKMNLYNEIRDHDPDPVSRLLAMYHSSHTGNYENQLVHLEKELGSLPEIVYLKYSLEAAKERRRNSVTISPGSVIMDFSAKSLKGNAFHLSEVLKKNKYTLVEFWASWCGPCRAEIPHMKSAYEKFHARGFEIVSFTLDHERERWTKASDEERLPWLNTGDLLAFKSPVVKMFGISGIPANYLVDPSGKIIAMNLRGEKLDEKLASLLSQ